MNVTWPDTRGDWQRWGRELHIDVLTATTEAAELAKIERQRQGEQIWGHSFSGNVTFTLHDARDIADEWDQYFDEDFGNPL